ncbi:4-alpha-glucanotransferase [Alteromonas macleodii]|jgi:4-alpha-glucanotransferase|uniref:4-alpha-glucanotransferase n=1 Tax=Alteromonas macleodii TaxID=28108 RepID=A0AB36FXF5_ALTMA|nr:MULTISPECIES: 4-alpha-glucanotransferase [Alteromonas]MCP3702468.1 4-alpha-glucanotransferase [Alteromonas sp.]MEC9275859.1 4-alpha-glucanotransferase [Pseudomonadota bacterium]MBC6984376.1 4-alpha-glucanotransferase [Alteromonas sp. BZK5]MED5326872.1 4-alpha-glucanotransferase [Pseudomonadota bacterium]MEE3307390.1 4-alpha-glucanotransferase [Pseudomonadota bacterium]|tara:strand:- start:569 stop:2767 length:2199 start_codon:yes stop_codon:yes gene_type:complete
MTQQLLQQLVEMRGIETQYVDAWGKPATIAESSKAKLLNTLGYDTSSDEKIQSQITQDIKSVWLSPLNPVQVVRNTQEINLAVRLPIELVNDDHTLTVTCENGDVLTHQFTPVDQEMTTMAHIDDVEFHEYVVTLPLDLPLGYHDVALSADDDEFARSRLIVAPEACYTPNEIKEGKKIWGLSVQLYCVRSEKNWGIGDFSDLALLIEKAAGVGADFIGLNPIHALYPANPNACSPYGPSSRRWLNYLYIDVTAIDGYDDASVQAVVSSDEFKATLEHARNVEHVDYEAVAHVKLAALKAVFDVYDAKYLRKSTKQNKAFKAFVEAGGESLDMLAVYDALQSHLKAEGKDSWGWPVFPQDYKDYYNPAVAKFKSANEQDVKFYLFLQWIAAQQLELASNKATDAGMTIGLYRDLAVGVSEGSAEIWGNKDLYCTGASVGAPPDILGPLGQNWGLPPMDPRKLYEQGYQPIIDLFASNMASSGSLRIDHVMALLRLWWVVKGDNAKDGGYVYYPVDDLLGILALESHRNQSLVIGEDLGTVPEEIRSKLADNGVYSYRVFFFEQAEDGGFFSPSHYPVQSMSTLTTHDMPTLIGYWHCLDLELGKEIGLYPTEEILQTLYADRHENKQAILDTLHGHGSIGDNVGRDVNHTGMNRELNNGMQVHMAGGSSALLSLQLEDWLEMDKPVNIPGTFDEYPNWRRKLTENIESMFDRHDINELASKLTHARKQASQG